MSALPPLPPGFTLDSDQSKNLPPLPAGFTLDQKPGMSRDEEDAIRRQHAKEDERLPGFGDAADFLTHTAERAFDAGAAIDYAVMHPIDTAKQIGDAIPGAIRSTADAIRHPLDTLSRAGDTSRTITGAQAGDLMGANITGAIAGEGVGQLAGAALKGAVSSAPKVAPELVQAAREKGFILKPSQAGGAVGKYAEGIVGSPKLSAEVSVHNQPIANKIIADEVGAEGKLTKDSLREAEKPHNAIYKAVSRLGPVDYDETLAKDMSNVGRNRGISAAALPAIKDLREAFIDRPMDAADYVAEIDYYREHGFKNSKAKDAPEINEKGRAQLQVAKALERRLDRLAEELGDFDIMNDYRNAREGLAKINNVKAALEGNTGNVSARKLSRQQARGEPLTGNLKLLADLWDSYGEAFTEANRVKNRTPVNVPFTIPRLATALTGTDVLARKVLKSDAYQDHIAPGPKKKLPNHRRATLADLPAISGATLADLDNQDDQK